MARNKLYIPYEVRESIKTHLSTTCSRATDGFESSAEDEDALTGHLFGLLKIKNQKVEIKDVELGGSGTWQWEIDYSKFRGRGLHATERHLGADGILVVKVERGGYTNTKSILFQAKVDWKNSGDIVNQAIRLSTWREAAFVLNYKPDEFEVISIDSAVRSRGSRKNVVEHKPLSEYLADSFLACKVGDTDLVYNATKKELRWRDIKGGLVHTKFSVPERLRISIKGPESTVKSSNVPTHKIHNHRMEATPQEILSLPDFGYDKGDLKDAKKEMALTYHPDRFQSLEKLEREILNRRTQESNAAEEQLKRSFNS